MTNHNSRLTYRQLEHSGNSHLALPTSALYSCVLVWFFKGVFKSLPGLIWTLTHSLITLAPPVTVALRIMLHIMSLMVRVMETLQQDPNTTSVWYHCDPDTTQCEPRQPALLIVVKDVQPEGSDLCVLCNSLILNFFFVFCHKRFLF